MARLLAAYATGKYTFLPPGRPAFAQLWRRSCNCAAEQAGQAQDTTLRRWDSKATRPEAGETVVANAGIQSRPTPTYSGRCVVRYENRGLQGGIAGRIPATPSIIPLGSLRSRALVLASSSTFSTTSYTLPAGTRPAPACYIHGRTPRVVVHRASTRPGGIVPYVTPHLPTSTGC
jgi:hypothetical protein